MPGADGGRPDVSAAPKRARYLRQFELVERVRAYDPSVDETLINRAYIYATMKHGSQKRHSGDPYFAHPIEVAGILTEYRLDASTIVAGLLHDTIEDTEATREEIAQLFGEPIAELVEGVTKLSKLEVLEEQDKQAANLQKFILAMSKDVRVLLVKLADRLHNMRTLAFHPKPESRKRIALETLDIYAPLARRIGMDRMSNELEELAFAEAYPEPHDAIVSRLETLRAARGDAIQRITEAITETFEASPIAARIYGRQKQPYSIWRKLQRKAVQFSDLADIFAFRVVVPRDEDCYPALGIVHQTWRCVPQQFEDFVSNPKPNGYQSIHTTVIGPGNVRVEIQIRSEEMDEYAEVGVAAHWRYKNQRYGFDAEGAREEGIDPRAAVRSLLEIAEQGGDSEEFLEHAKLDLYHDHVFAFTPKGTLIDLPTGATPLDFAYAVHSDIGDTCIGARINGVEKPLRTQLANGDVVEVICAAEPAPVPGWASLTKTGRAKSAQRRLERQQRHEEFVKLGRDLVAHALHRHGHDLAETDLEEAAQRLNHSSVEELFAAVGEGGVKPNDVALAAFPALAERIRNEHARAPMNPKKMRLYVRGSGLTPGVTMHLAECCSPIPGDRIVGVHEAGRGVVVHTIDCERLEVLEGQDPEWLDLQWTENARDHALAVGRIRATVENGRGVLAALARIISENEGDILNIRTVQRRSDFFDLVFDIEVADTRRMAHILAAMRASKAVREAERVRG
ncbi:MAG: bifunctional (p)ppGpp synthetase/guanosine-3',5'-bis(diphosphate) 3'-pyrophosphohydrolase [Hyphomonadaceae bacterium]|nr:bifunctional (p)ppGpp synthetase/guanosine-3',5'-bis(diphosphate) 3'-pyrophosphohydrolase [Hyphomonadaceae bacterium]